MTSYIKEGGLHMPSSMGINLIWYLAMMITGFVGAAFEIRYKKHYKIHIAFFILLFYLAVISRIGHAYDYSDFGHYIDYFMDDNDAYFEPGYVLITQFIKNYLGYSPIYLISSIFVLVLIAAFLVEFELNKQYCNYKNDGIITTNYIFVFLSIWSVYHGFSACAEGVRPGLAVTILYISMALALNRKWIPSLMVLVLSAFIHTQAVILLPGIVLLFFIDSVPRKVLCYWFVANVLVGLLIGLFKLFDFTLLEYLFNIMDSRSDASHYEGYLSATENSFLSTQWITKQLVAFLLLFGNHSNKLYNRATMLYYFGLSIAAVMSASTVFLRFEAIYIPAFLLAFYYFLRDDGFSKYRRIRLLALFLPYYGIMLVRWLGWYI